MKFEGEEASLVGRYLGCSVARLRRRGVRQRRRAAAAAAPPELPRSPSSSTCGSSDEAWGNTRRGRGPRRARVSDLVFIDDDDLDADARGAGGDSDPRRVR